MAAYTPTIGIEVHAELKTASKMFCGCKNDPHASEPNQNICPICTAQPGSLPVVNKEAVKKVLMVGKAIEGELADFSEFDRKQYFYPDIPKAYQLSQYAFPFVKGGVVAGVEITRVHLEEDTARSQHSDEDSVVDFNRAGVPLMELVTEPVIHDSKEAAKFAKELQLLLRTLGVSEANMEKGEMRVEANISVSKSDILGTKVEVKNLNSFKAVEMAIEYEIKRQMSALEAGEAVKQETRGWDMAKNKTFSQRSKEQAQDYRYFPDPDIPKYQISEITEFSDSSLSEIMPKTPNEIRDYLKDLGLSDEQTETLLNNEELYHFFQKSIENGSTSTEGAEFTRLAANYITSDIAGILAKDSTIKLDSTHAIQFRTLVSMIVNDELTSRAAKDLLPEVVIEGKDPQDMATNRGILQVNSNEALSKIIETVINDNPTVVDEYKNGKETAIQYLIGQGMKATKGSANPASLKKLLEDELKR